MTQVPDYLLQRSAERRAALGLPPYGSAPGAAPPAAPAEGAPEGEGEAPAAVPAPAGEAAAPAPAAAAPPAPVVAERESATNNTRVAEMGIPDRATAQVPKPITLDLGE